MVVTDSILFRSGNTDKYIILAVWGQDIYYHYRDVSEGVWPNDKPHLVYDYTGVDEDKSLIIQPGTQVYFHRNARFIVYRGSLNIQGQLDNEVVFQGDRLEEFYENVHGQWYGLRYVEAQPSSIDYLILKNSLVGLQIDSTRTSTGYTVSARNSQFYNMSFFGIYPVAGARLELENCVVNNCGLASAFLYAGGAYNFRNCTFGNNGSQIRSTPLFLLKDNFTSDGTTYIRPVDEANFYNCVIYGSQEDELGLDVLGANVNFLFDHCLIRNSEVLTGTSFFNCIWNQNLNFVRCRILLDDKHLGHMFCLCFPKTTNLEY
jgi:hypothetical protein